MRSCIILFSTPFKGSHSPSPACFLFLLPTPAIALYPVSLSSNGFDLFNNKVTPSLRLLDTFVTAPSYRSLKHTSASHQNKMKLSAILLAFAVSLVAATGDDHHPSKPPHHPPPVHTTQTDYTTTYTTDCPVTTTK